MHKQQWHEILAAQRQVSDAERVPQQQLQQGQHPEGAWAEHGLQGHSQEQWQHHGAQPPAAPAAPDQPSWTSYALGHQQGPPGTQVPLPPLLASLPAVASL